MYEATWMKNAPLRSNSSIKQNFTHLVYVIVEILLCSVALHKQILMVIFFPYSFPPSSPFSLLPLLSALFPSSPLFSLMHYPRVRPGGPSSLSCIPPSFFHMIHLKVGVASPYPHALKHVSISQDWMV
jgi:hypothetical protein